MTDIKQRFEELFLDGRDRSNVMVSSQLHLGADGEYFNPNTRALFRFYRLGLEDGIDKSVGVVPPEPEPPEPVGIDPCCGVCQGAGDGRGRKCSTCWTHLF